MESEKDLTALQSQVMQKIGRNLLNFQRIEHILKLLISISRISGDINTFEKNYKKRTKKFHKNMMGVLVKEFLKNILVKVGESSESATENPKEFTTSFAMEVDADFYKLKEQSMGLMVKDRNDLIHHLESRLDLTSVESCLEIEEYLDQQRERVIPEFDFLEWMLKGFGEAMKCQADFYNSEEGLKHLELIILQQSPLVLSLRNISIQHARSDGWMLLDNADKQLRIALPEAMKQLKKRYGYKTLREIIIASELFETLEEQTKKGGVRFLYRPKAEINFEQVKA